MSAVVNTFVTYLFTRTFFVFLLGLAVPIIFFSVYQFSTADSGTIRPDANGTVTGTTSGCGAGGVYDCLNDAITQPTPVPTGSDYVTWVNNDASFFLMQNSITDVNTATSVTVWFNHVEGGTNAVQTIGLYAANESTVYAGPTNVPSRASAQWDSVTFNGLSLTQAQLDDLRIRVACTKIGGGTSNTCTGYAMYATVNYSKQYEVNVGTTGTQQNLSVGVTDAHIGGAFAISSITGTRNITSITIAETGSVNAQTNLDNIRLYYDLDVSSPYNCVGETYAGTEPQFGQTDTDGFSGANGTSVFSTTTGPTISTTQALCVYVVLDVLGGAVSGETVEVQITNPSTQVVATGGADVQPNTAVALSGTTVLTAPYLQQIRYHWRNDDGNENDPGGATSARGGSYDEPHDTLAKESPIRLRLEVSNEGNASSNATQYRLEYGRKISLCSSITSDSAWVNVGDVGGDWDMYDSVNLANGSDTTDIAQSIGGVPNENITFLTPNGGVMDTSSQTGNITLTSTEFVELEYSIVSTASSTEGYNYCFRVTDAGTPINSYTAYPEATILADLNVSTNGSQRATVDIPTSNIDAGADFILTDNLTGTTTIQSITITASGTVDYQNDIDNVELWYDLDTTGGDSYNCSDESFNGDELQYGTTDANGFDVNGESTFSESLELNPTRSLCLYVVYTVSSAVSNDETLDIFISNAAQDVTISSGSVSPASLVDLAGITTFVTDDLSQAAYHWRNDDGDEDGATSATNGTENTTKENLRQETPIRLRIGMANEGSSTTQPYQYRLEYALRVSSCGSASGWQNVADSGGAFDMYDSANYADGGNTTNIVVADGGVTDGADTYLTTNGALKDTSSQTGAITLPGKYFVDLEYSIQATASSTEGATYCFRVTDAGTPFAASVYAQYPKVVIKPRTDFFTQRDVETITGTSLTITAGVDYIAPRASTTAFIRITNTLNSGAGGGTVGNADDVTVYISNPSNIRNSITFTRPAAATGNTRVAWEIIEYVGAPGGDNEIIVRRQSTATYGSTGTTVNSPTTAVTDDADVVVFITGQINPDTLTNYPYGNSTAAWNAGSDIATFTRGASGNTSGVSYAIVEFVGDNWKIQRAQHTYSAVGTEETESISPVGSQSRAFVHSQKRMGSGLNTHGDYGHQVWLSTMGQLSFVIDSTASTPGSHTSVAWVVENTQTIGTIMDVHRSSGGQSGGAAPATVNVDIGETISDVQDASIFISNTGNEPGGGGGQNSFPEPMLSARLISTTQYEIWVADTSDSRSWQAEVVEWPTAARDIEQNYYMFFVNNNELDPVDPWPEGATDIGENTEITELDGPIALGDVMRLRMTLQISSADMVAGIDTFTLQYGERASTCTAIDEDDWHDVGGIGSTTALWRGTSTPLTDGTPLSTDPPTAGDLNITSVADVAGTFEEENPSATTPYDVNPGEDVEFDWAVQHNGAKEKTSYCFRMIEANGTLFDNYNTYPTMRTAGYTPLLTRWQFFDDETSLTPSNSLAAENTSPIDIGFDNTIKLRTTVQELTGGEGTDIKFKLQFSEYSDFSQAVFDVASRTACSALDLWCYADGAGADNGVIDSAVLSDADTCSGGSGAGCGTHNEDSATTTATFDQQAYATTEYEFTLRHAGARANAVYYFRLYDVTNDAPVTASTTEPSLSTEGASLVFTVTGLPAGTTTENVTLDVNSSSTAISFPSITIDAEYEAAHRITVDTNATEGYQVLMYSDQFLTNTYGDNIQPVSGTNAAPSGWSEGCDAGLVGCFGYHTGDETLQGGSSRFGAFDSYARLSTTTPEEVMYSSAPTNEFHDIVYKIQVGEDQPAGAYESSITYIVIPVH